MTMARVLTLAEVMETHGTDLWEEWKDGHGAFRCGVYAVHGSLKIEYREQGMRWSRTVSLANLDLEAKQTASTRYWDSYPTELERRVATWL